MFRNRSVVGSLPAARVIFFMSESCDEDPFVKRTSNDSFCSVDCACVDALAEDEEEEEVADKMEEALEEEKKEEEEE